MHAGRGCRNPDPENLVKVGIKKNGWMVISFDFELSVMLFSVCKEQTHTNKHIRYIKSFRTLITHAPASAAIQTVEGHW